MDAPRMSALGLNSSDGLVNYGRYQGYETNDASGFSYPCSHHCSFGKLLEPRILSWTVIVYQVGELEEMDS